MIEPTDADIGRAVVYRPFGCAPELGAVVTWNAAYVFVRYQGEQHAKATRPQDLEWEGSGRAQPG